MKWRIKYIHFVMINFPLGGLNDVEINMDYVWRVNCICYVCVCVLLFIVHWKQKSLIELLKNAILQR